MSAPATVDALIAALRGEQDALGRQIAALEASHDLDDPTARLEILLRRYLLDGSAKRAVDWATSMGWRVASLNHGQPSTRNWQAKDLYDALQGGPGAPCADLIELCNRVFDTNRGKARRSW